MKKFLCLLLTALLLCGCAKTENESSSVLYSSQQTSQGVSSHKALTSRNDGTAVIIKNAQKNELKYHASYSDGLIFPNYTDFAPISETSYHYYKNLSNKLKAAYRRLCDAVERMTEGFVSLGDISKKEVDLLFTAVKYDHPEYFWLSSKYIISQDDDGYSIAFKYSGGNVSADYLMTPEERDAAAQKIKQKIASAQQMVSGLAVFEREKVLHDFVLKNCTYDNEAVDQSDQHPNAFTVYGALIEGRAVCEGYARSVQLLLNYFGIECSLVSGQSAGGGHMWNLVRINGSWYHLDPTWNDTDNSIVYSYFNLSDAGIKLTHTIDADYTVIGEDDARYGFNISLPAANSSENSYFSRKNTMINDLSLTQPVVLQGIVSAVRAGGTSEDFGYADSIVNRLSNGSQISEAINVDRLFNIVSSQTGKRVEFTGIITSSNKNFQIMWSIK